MEEDQTTPPNKTKSRINFIDYFMPNKEVCEIIQEEEKRRRNSRNTQTAKKISDDLKSFVENDFEENQGEDEKDFLNRKYVLEKKKKKKNTIIKSDDSLAKKRRKKKELKFGAGKQENMMKQCDFNTSDFFDFEGRVNFNGVEKVSENIDKINKKIYDDESRKWFKKLESGDKSDSDHAIECYGGIAIRTNDKSTCNDLEEYNLMFEKCLQVFRNKITSW